MTEYFSIPSFWAITFLTCIVGIFELLPELERWNEKNKIHKIVVGVLYFVLLMGATLFLERCISYYRTLRPVDLIEGSPVFDYLLISPFDWIAYPAYLATLFIIFTLLFYAKVTALESKMEEGVYGESKQRKREPECFRQYDFRSEECYNCEYRNKCRGSKVVSEAS